MANNHEKTQPFQNLLRGRARTLELRPPAREQVAKLQLDLLFQNSGPSAIWGAAAAAALVGLSSYFAKEVVMGWWFVALLLTATARWLLCFSYRGDTESKHAHWLTWVILFNTVSGATWGMAGIILASDFALLQASFGALWVAAVCASVLTMYAVIYSTFLAFVIPALAPLALFLLLANEPSYPPIGIGLSVYLVFMVATGWRTQRNLQASLSLQAQNERLFADLGVEKQHVEELNEILRADIEERQLAEAELHKAKDEAERLAKKLGRLSAQDGLTGIGNRRQFDDSLNREWSRAIRENGPISLVMLDIDYFKRFNDHYGHRAGDDCLKQIAELLRGYCRRGSDVAARYGGEEFVLLLPNSDSEAAQAIAEQIRQAIVGLAIEHERSGCADHVTASLGVSTILPHRNMHPDQLVAIADRALYDAKRLGRNVVIRNQPVVPLHLKIAQA